MKYYEILDQYSVQEQANKKGKTQDILENESYQLAEHIIKLLAFYSTYDIKHHYTDIDNQWGKRIREALIKGKKYWKPNKKEVLPFLQPSEEEILDHIISMESDEYKTLPRFCTNEQVIKLIPVIYDKLLDQMLNPNRNRINIEEVFIIIGIDPFSKKLPEWV